MMVIMWTGPSVCCFILQLGSVPRLNCVFVAILKLLTACKLLAVLWRVQTTKPTTFSFVIFGLLFVLTHRNRITGPTSWLLRSRSNRIGQRTHNISIVMYTLASTSYLTLEFAAHQPIDIPRPASKVPWTTGKLPRLSRFLKCMIS